MAGGRTIEANDQRAWVEELPQATDWVQVEPHTEGDGHF